MKKISKLDTIRANYMKSIATKNSISGKYGCWSHFKPLFDNLIQTNSNNKPTAKSILSLGDNLKNIAYSSPQDGNSQRAKQNIGTAWNFITVWYLNLIFWKTDILVTGKPFLPKPLGDCLNLEANGNDLFGPKDILMAFSVPNRESFEESDIEDFYEGLSNHLYKNLHSIEAVAINTRTNFSDVIKEDMLWSILFEFSKNDLFKNQSRIKFGTDIVNANMLSSFSYSLISAPSGKRNYKENHKEIIRSKQLTGGFYWGMKTKKGIASSIREFPQNHFLNKYPSEEDLEDHINKLISYDDSYIENFLNLSW